MKLGVIGLPAGGKSTVFRALTGGVTSGEQRGHQEPGIGVLKVEDERLAFLARLYQPKKVTPVHVEYLDIAGLTGEGERGRDIGDRVLGHMRPLDALIHCLRFFQSPLAGPPDPIADLHRVEEEMILSDLATVEKRMERLASDIAKGRKELLDEHKLLEACADVLQRGRPLRVLPESIAQSEKLKGFAFLSAKPELFLVNAGEDKSVGEVQEVLTEIGEAVGDQPRVAWDWLYADAEAEISRLEPEDAAEFLEDLGLDRKAKDRIVGKSFSLLDLIVFFTAGEKEVRAWPLPRHSTALQAAGAIHSDIQRGFIRAEVTAYDDFRAFGSAAEVQKAGRMRLEGKEYEVNDGDIILFRFNV